MGKKILVVDDATFMRSVLTNIFRKNGYKEVFEAVNGKDGLLKYKEIKPDLVTLDITMPEMDGLEAAREIKKHDPNAKILMCSAMGQKDFVVDAIQAGAQDFIVKPFKEGAVMDKVRALIG